MFEEKYEPFIHFPVVLGLFFLGRVEDEDLFYDDLGITRFRRNYLDA